MQHFGKTWRERENAFHKSLDEQEKAIRATRIVYRLTKKIKEKMNRPKGLLWVLKRFRG